MNPEAFYTRMMDFPADAKDHLMRSFYFALADLVGKSTQETPSPEEIIVIVHAALQSEPELRPDFHYLPITIEEEPDKIVAHDWLLHNASRSPLKNPSEGLSMAEYYEQRLDCYNWTPGSVLEGGSRYLCDVMHPDENMEGGWPLLTNLLETGEGYE